MRQKTERHQKAADRTIKDICRQTRGKYTAQDKIRIVLSGLKGEDSIAVLYCSLPGRQVKCRREGEGIAQSQYYSWPKEFLEAGKKRASYTRWLAFALLLFTKARRTCANPQGHFLLSKALNKFLAQFRSWFNLHTDASLAPVF